MNASEARAHTIIYIEWTTLSRTQKNIRRYHRLVRSEVVYFALSLSERAIGSLTPSSVFFIAAVGPGVGPPVGPEYNLAFGKVQESASRSAFQSL